MLCWAVGPWPLLHERPAAAEAASALVRGRALHEHAAHAALTLPGWQHQEGPRQHQVSTKRAQMPLDASKMPREASESSQDTPYGAHRDTHKT